MTARERVACAFEHRPYDRVPIYQAGFSSAVASQIIGRKAHVGGGTAQYLESCAVWRGPEAQAEYLERVWQDSVELSRRLELDVVRTVWWRLAEKPTRRVDEYTFVYGDEGAQWRMMRYSPETELYQVVARTPAAATTVDDIAASVEAAEAALSSYEPSAGLLENWERTLAEFGEDGVPYGGGGVSVGIPYESIWLEAMALRPEVVGRYLMVQAEQGARNARFAGARGMPYLYGGGDFASSLGPFYSPRTFHELVLPALQHVSAACREAGAFHGFASDGNLWPVADDLFGASGVSFYYEIDTAAGMDFAKLRERFPRLTLMGGVNSATLHRGTEAQVVAETRAALEVAKEHGGCIVGCSNQVVAGTPMANFWAMMEVLHNERNL